MSKKIGREDRREKSDWGWGGGKGMGQVEDGEKREKEKKEKKLFCGIWRKQK